MTDKPKIMIVDDEPVNPMIMEAALSQEYDVTIVHNGFDCLDQISTLKPSLIFLDVLMPDMNGLEVCKRLRDTPATEGIPVIFVSGLNSSEERMKCYDVGGDDFVIKPASPQELLTKAKMALQNSSLNKQLHADAEKAKKAALEAISDAGELGVIIDFFQGCFECDTINEVVGRLFKATSSYNLDCSVQVRTYDQRITVDDQWQFIPIEEEILTKSAEQGKTLQFGSKVILNYKTISLLIKNMPIDNEEKCKRINEHIPIMMEGAESKVQSLCFSMNIKEKHESLHKMAKYIDDALQQIEKKVAEQQERNNEIMTDMVKTLEMECLKLGLDQDQEEYIIEVVNENLSGALEAAQKGYSLDKILGLVMAKITQVLDEV